MAPHAISLTDGTTTINMNSVGGNVTLDYEMGVPDSGKDDFDGEPEITETLTVMLYATTGPLLQAMINSVEALLVAAKRRKKTQMGARIYLQLQVDGDANTWRAEVLDGEFHPDKDMLKIGWPNLRAEGALMITHRVWEGPRKELLIASSSSTTPATGGKPITNASADWIQILNTQVGGVLPTPVELQLTNTSGSAIGYGKFFLATNWDSDPTNFGALIEGEASVSAGTVTSLGTCSGGQYFSYPFTNTGEIQFTLSSTKMQQTRGRTFQLIVRFASWSGTNIYVRPIIRNADTTIIYYGDETKLPAITTSALQNLGSVPLPPGAYYASYAGLTLSFLVRATGAANVSIDFIQLTPLDAYQNIVQISSLVPNGNTITFDNIEGVLQETGNLCYSPRTGRLKVYPGKTQRIHILYDEATNTDITRTMTVKAFIRERRLTV